MIVVLHGGWGYEAYPFEVQIAALDTNFRILIPDRSGYGRSTPLASLPPTFHELALRETIAVLDELGITDAIWWGHSDGAVIAALAGIEHPERCRAVILEALHLDPRKPGSRAFFEQMARDPDSFGTTLTARLAAEHGPDRWRRVLELDGHAWLEIARSRPTGDLFDGRLTQLEMPTLLIHGGRDPRCEPGEWEAIVAAVRHAMIGFHPSAGHSPHSEPDTAEAVTADVLAFLEEIPHSPDAVAPR